METPSSLRRITRSQASAASQKVALLDITNDSPIVGVAIERTPGSSKSGLRVTKKEMAPGSGEALLRGQVRTLLQKVEEEGEMMMMATKLGSCDRPGFKTILDLPAPSPAAFVGPTPANTPQFGGLPVAGCVEIGDLKEMLKEEEQVNRALLFDSPEKSEASSDSVSITSIVSSSVTFQGSDKSTTDDEVSSSAWSLKVNPSSSQHSDEEALFDELCDGLSKMSVKNNDLPVFAGTHTRFVYDDEGEVIVGEEVEKLSPSVTVLKGLPKPEGKHLRFQDEE